MAEKRKRGRPPKKKSKPKAPKKKPGRPKGSVKLKIDKKIIEQVEIMAGLNLTIDEIAMVLGISERTLSRYKKNNPELMASYKKGKIIGHQEAKEALRDLIKARNPAGVIFYLKTQCGYKETEIKKHTVEFEENQDLSNLNDTELDQFIELRKKIKK